MARGPERERWEKALFLSGLYAASATLLEEMVLDRAPGIGPQHGPLIRLLQAWASQELAALPRATVLLVLAARHLEEQQAATVAFHREHAGRVATFTAEEITREGHRWGVARTGAAAGLVLAGRDELLPELEALLEELCALHLLRSELLGLPRDLERGHFTRPIVALLEETGHASAPLVPERVLGAALLADAVPSLAREGRDRAERLAARAAVLPSLAADAAGLARAFGEVLEMFSAQAALRMLARLAPPPPPPAPATGPPLLAARLDRALAMAEALLLDDPSLRECWEVHRWGMVRSPLLTGRALPGAMLVENLAAGGADAGDRADHFFRIFEANGFRMYDEPNTLPPDLDTLGVYLRLRRYTRDPEGWTGRLEPFLGAAEEATPPTGDTPIWLGNAPDSARRGSEENAIIGAHCVTCHAGYLLGLLDPLVPTPRTEGEAVRRLRTHTLGSIARFGTGGAAYYSSLYSAWIMARLLRRLDERGEARAAVTRALEREARTSRLSAQDAALLLLSHAELELEPRPVWLEALLAQQKQDGGWDPEPYYLTAQPGGGSGWHKSRLLTSSLCFRALATSRGRREL